MIWLELLREKITVPNIAGVLFEQTYGLSVDITGDRSTFADEWNKCVFAAGVVCDYLLREETP